MHCNIYFNQNYEVDSRCNKNEKEDYVATNPLIATLITYMSSTQ